MSKAKNTTVALTILPKAIGGKSIPSVSARELHAQLEIKRDFSTWIKQYIGKPDWREHSDYEVFPTGVENPQGGRPSFDAALSIEMGEHLAMMTRTAIGRQVREYFRQARDERDQLVHAQALQPATPAEVALALAQAVVTIERRQLAIETRQDEQAAAIDALTTRRPPEGKLRIEDWLRREAKPYLNKDLMRLLRAACNERERPAEFRPEGMDWPLRYYSPATIADAYEAVTRQLGFFSHDPGVPYRRSRKVTV